MAKLVVFYSRADENYFGDAYRYVTDRNTEKTAKFIFMVFVLLYLYAQMPNVSAGLIKNNQQLSSKDTNIYWKSRFI